jgi:hypothetical protein
VIFCLYNFKDCRDPRVRDKEDEEGGLVGRNSHKSRLGDISYYREFMLMIETQITLKGPSIETSRALKPFSNAVSGMKFTAVLSNFRDPG